MFNENEAREYVEEKIKDKDFIKNHIYLRLVPASAETADGYFYDVPGCPSILFEAYVYFKKDLHAAVKEDVLYAIFGKDAITDPDYVYDIAFANTERDILPVKLSWVDIGFPDTLGVDIISTEGLNYGPIAIFTSDILRTYKKDVIVAFTSRYEAMVHYDDAVINDLDGIMKALNGTNIITIAQGIFLSSHIFKFDYKKGELIEL